MKQKPEQDGTSEPFGAKMKIKLSSGYFFNLRSQQLVPNYFLYPCKFPDFHHPNFKQINISLQADSLCACKLASLLKLCLVGDMTKRAEKWPVMLSSYPTNNYVRYLKGKWQLNVIASACIACCLFSAKLNCYCGCVSFRISSAVFKLYNSVSARVQIKKGNIMLLLSSFFIYLILIYCI